MHILLTDLATCPRCGPEFGLILLADRIENRRIQEGWLGCANCREQYRVSRGVADLRVPSGATLAGTSAPAGGGDGEPDQEQIFQIAALLGVTEGPGTLLALGLPTELSLGLAAIVPDVEFVAVDSPDPRPGRNEISQIVVSERIPLRSLSVRGMVTSGVSLSRWGDDATRVLRPDARLVVVGATSESAGQAAALGLRLLLDQEGVVVASKGAGR